MFINEITIFSYHVEHVLGSYTMSGGRTIGGQPTIVLRIRTDDGHEGWAEGSPIGSTYLPSSYNEQVAALKELSPQVLGQDPRNPSAISAVMDRAMLSGTAAKAVIDFACWDCFGRAVGLPTHTLLGGSLNNEIRGLGVVGFTDLGKSVELARSEVAKGVTCLQVKIGGDPVAEANRVTAIRRALPSHIEISADANCGWNLEQALTFGRVLGSDVCIPLEQPCRTLSESAEVGRRTGLPIILDECIVTLQDLFAAHAAGIAGINLKSSRVGGFTKARILRDAAIALNIMVTIDDTWGCSLTTSQNLQMAATTRSDLLRCVDSYVEWTTPMIAEAPRLQSNGTIMLPKFPGNGYGPINIEMLGEPLFQIHV